MNFPKFENKPFKPPRRLATTKSTVAGVVVRNGGVKRNLPKLAPHPESKRPKTPDQSEETEGPRQNIFTIMYRKPSNKKHKTWNGDGFAVRKSSERFVFYDDSGKFIGGSTYTGEKDLVCDNIFRAGGLEIQLDYEIVSKDERLEAEAVLVQPSKTSKTNGKGVSRVQESQLSTQDSSEEPLPEPQSPVTQKLERKSTPKFKAAFKPSRTLTPLSGNNERVKPKYLPVFDVSKIENPIIMNKAADADVDVIIDPIVGKSLRPHQREGVKFMYDCISGLARPSKPVSKETDTDQTSTSLLLERDSDISGCLLADEMGLGKTLMTIALIWTLLKQNPRASQVPCSQSGVPLQGSCSKVLIVCPVTLIANWKREFGKWLNLTRIGILTLSANNTAERDRYDVRNFLKVQRTYQVLIVGYEKLLTVSEELKSSKSSLDLLVCDEGHRLKNGASKILNILKALDVDRKVLLSGTPIQNDLIEYYTVVDFINPGVLGSFSSFKKHFINPILRARDPANRFNESAVEKGEERSKELIEITQRFTLRRTNSILSEFLPPRTDMILFCKPTEAQVSAFKDMIQGTKIDFGSLNVNSSLALITLLKKVCNSPSLISNDSFYCSTLKESKISTKYERALNSGKLKVLMALLERIRNGTDGEKVVVVSNYTQTLDIIESIMRSADMKICRLDGSTQSKQRDSIVTSFNKDSSIFAFLLSAKSGGVGLNLIGASRLILFDNDWNPSVDLQAMSRIHRDGQKRPCYIYRLITTGCIDEKILQRQLVKHSLSQRFLCDTNAEEGHADDDLFKKEDLKDLFTVSTDISSNTHDLICPCKGEGDEVIFEDQTASDKDSVSLQRSKLDTWQTALEANKALEDLGANDRKSEANLLKKCLVGYKHIDPKMKPDLLDPVATEAVSRLQSDVSFVFVKPGKTFSSNA